MSISFIRRALRLDRLISCKKFSYELYWGGKGGGGEGGEGRWGERASVRGERERERGLIFEEYGVVFDVQVLSRLCSFCLLSACFHRSAVKQKTQAYLAQLI